MDYKTSLLLVALTIAGCDETSRQEAGKDASRQQVLTSRGLDPKQVESGRKVYDRHCAACHGAGGKGQPGDWRVRKPNGLYPPPPLDDTAHAWHHPTAILRKAILQGSPPDMGDMPPWEGKLTGAEIDNVIVYIKSLWSDEVYRHWLEIERNAMEN